MKPVNTSSIVIHFSLDIDTIRIPVKHISIFDINDLFFSMRIQHEKDYEARRDN